MEIHFKLIGVILIVLGIVHVIFPKYFDWKNQLKSLNLINRQLMWVHTFFIALGVVLMGLLCVTSAHELINTSLGKKISLGLGVFWLARLLIQFFGYSAELWKGKKFETTVHILFTILWIYLTAIFLGNFFI